MNNVDLYRSIGAVDDALLERSDHPSKHRSFKWAIAAAACLCVIVGTIFAVGRPRRNVGGDPPHIPGDDPQHTPGGMVGQTDEPAPPTPVPPDHNHLLRIDGKDYMVTEVRSDLPEGCSFFRELSEEEQCGTGLAGYKLYLDAEAENLWQYQPADTVVEKAYTGGLPTLPDGTTDYPEWVYTHWEPAPKPIEREPENGPETAILPDTNPDDGIAPTEESTADPTNETLPIPTKDTTPALLSALPREEQIRFLKEKGIDVPEYAEDYIITLIFRVEEDPSHPIAISNPVVFKLGERVQDAVNEYYGRNG